MATRVAHRATQETAFGLKKKQPRYLAALLQNPPGPTLTRGPIHRPKQDLPFELQDPSSSKSAWKKRLQPQPIVWEVLDRVRLQFYKDHPWERERARQITESSVLTLPFDPQGGWLDLRQKSRNPTPDDAVDFIVYLHEKSHVPLKEAYKRGITEFRALRSMHEHASRFARLEAEAYGAHFSAIGYIGAFVKAENNALRKWENSQIVDQVSGGSKTGREMINPRWNLPTARETMSGGVDYFKASQSDMASRLTGFSAAPRASEPLPTEPASPPEEKATPKHRQEHVSVDEISELLNQ